MSGHIIGKAKKRGGLGLSFETSTVLGHGIMRAAEELDLKRGEGKQFVHQLSDGLTVVVLLFQGEKP